MSGAKRRTKYRKHVTQDFSDSERVPKEGELYAEIDQSHGGNIFGILTSEGVNTLARLPTKFRKLIWVKRGDMVMFRVLPTSTKPLRVQLGVSRIR